MTNQKAKSAGADCEQDASIVILNLFQDPYRHEGVDAETSSA
jgi:hypothetical protein